MIELRAFAEEDAPVLNAAVAASAEHLRPWLPWASEPPMSDAARRLWIAERRREAQAGGDRVFGVWLDGTLVGTVGLHRRIGPGALEIGYWTHAAFTRRGIAATAVERLCVIAFAEPSVRRVEIHHDVANTASGAVARAAGFTHVSDERREPKAPADAGAERVWRLTREAWQERPRAHDDGGSPGAHEPRRRVV